MSFVGVIDADRASSPCVGSLLIQEGNDVSCEIIRLAHVCIITGKSEIVFVRFLFSPPFLQTGYLGGSLPKVVKKIVIYKSLIRVKDILAGGVGGVKVGEK